MGRFYIKKILVTGPEKEPSSVHFTDGLNIIYGPSNKGKSYVLTCIDYIFGKNEEDYPFEDDEGFDKVSVTIVVKSGEHITISRRLGENTANVVSNFPDIKGGDYRTDGKEPQLGNIFLKLVGIEPGQKIVAKADFWAKNLTWRSLLHLFIVDERRIIQKEPVITVSYKGKPSTESISALLHLVSAPDFSNFIQKEKKEIKKAKKDAKTKYIGQKISDLTTRAKEITDFLAQLDGIDVNANINALVNNLKETEHEILQASLNSRTLLSQIYEISGKLEECIFLQDRYTALKTQYKSDLKRLKFIVTEGFHHSSDSKGINCPFCDGELQEQERQIYLATSAEEANAVEAKLKGLKEVIDDLIQERTQFEAQLVTLKYENSLVMALINTKLAPKAEELRLKLEEYRLVVEKMHELALIKDLTKNMNVDLGQIAVEDKLPTQYKPREQFDFEFYKTMSDYLSEMLEACNYEGFVSARFDKDTFDSVINHKKKKSEGKGFAAFVNTVVAFTTMRYLALHGKFAPGLLILDSPILSLKEDVEKDEEASEGMKASLFRYLIENQMYGQVIVIENELPPGNFEQANCIWFAGDKAGPNDRYGFLSGVRQGQGRS